MRIDVLGLQAFLSIAERGSFQRAAAHLNLSQTALSHRMRKLEQDLGLKLLVRTTRQVTLTPAGLELLPKARRIIEEVAQTFQELRQRGETQQRRVAVGCLPTLAVHYLPDAIRAFAAAYPDVAVKVFDNSAGEISQLVQSGEADFGITILAASIWDLEVAPLLKEPFVLLVPEEHEFARLNAVGWGQLSGTPLVRISPAAGNRVLIDDALGARRDSLNWRYEVQHVATAAALVRAGVGLTIVPRLAVDIADMPGVVAVRLQSPAIARTLGVVMKRGLPLSPAGEALLKLIEKRIKGHARRNGLGDDIASEPGERNKRGRRERVS